MRAKAMGLLARALPALVSVVAQAPARGGGTAAAGAGGGPQAQAWQAVQTLVTPAIQARQASVEQWWHGWTKGCTNMGSSVRTLLASALALAHALPCPAAASCRSPATSHVLYPAPNSVCVGWEHRPLPISWCRLADRTKTVRSKALHALHDLLQACLSTAAPRPEGRAAAAAAAAACFGNLCMLLDAAPGSALHDPTCAEVREMHDCAHLGVCWPHHRVHTR